MAQRDESGPDHAPICVSSTVIDGVLIVSSPFVEYDAGILTELYRPEWGGLFAPGEEIGHLYTVFSPRGGTRKEWYFHEHTLDRYMVLSGTLSVGLYDGRRDSGTFRGFQVVELSEPGRGQPSALRIPPGVWHSLRWESESGMFLNAKYPAYNRELPDKFRVPLDQLPEEIRWHAE